jgi:2-haloacid dehalogenase
MATRPAVVVFDVNETLSDLSPMAQRFSDVGLDPLLARLWFASVLRDGFALAAAGSSERFARLAEGALRGLLAADGSDRDEDAAVEQVMGGFAGLPVHPDVPDGVRALRRLGLRLVTLSNGSTQVAERLLASAGITEEFERLLSVDDAGAWKPARRAYGYAAASCEVEMSQMLLVAVHPWDVDGAARAGMSTAWVNRTRGRYPAYFTEPTYTVEALTELPALLAP